MTVFLSGGCKNGKSTLAEQTAVHLSQPGRLYYLATMIPHDEEDRARIARHVASRSGLGFQTIECGLGLEAALQNADAEGTYLARLLKNMVFVSDYIYSDALAYGDLTEQYRRGLAYIDRSLAAACDTVVEVSFGGRIVYKGELPV